MEPLKQIKTYIFDLDGTLALIDHRRHFVEGTAKPNWKAFSEACDKDLPNKPVIDLFIHLVNLGYRVIISSGRTADVKDKTLEWIETRIKGNPLFNKERYYLCDNIELLMRPSGDTTPDDVLKLNWLKEGMFGNKADIMAVFDDRNKVVDMWRSEGITCFQVAEGNF